MKYGIWRECHYYADANHVPTDDWVRNDYGSILAFESFARAQRFAENLDRMQFNGGRYYLRHGEYASPDFEAKQLDGNADFEEWSEE